MDMQQLRLLVSVSQTLNFSETAKKYFITQPAVSHQIKALEQELDVVLLFRNGHNVRFTAEGLAFLEYAMSILDLENQARTVCTEFGHWIGGTFKNFFPADPDGGAGAVSVQIHPQVPKDPCHCGSDGRRRSFLKVILRKATIFILARTACL